MNEGVKVKVSEERVTNGTSNGAKQETASCCPSDEMSRKESESLRSDEGRGTLMDLVSRRDSARVRDAR